MRKRLVGTDHHNDEAFLDLSKDARLVYLHLITHPQMTSLGLLRATAGGLADECELQRSECVAALDELAAVGRLEYDKRCVALSAEYLEEPANPSVVTGWGKIVALLPRTALVRRRVYRAVAWVRQRGLEAQSSSWEEAIPETMWTMASEASGAGASGVVSPSSATEPTATLDEAPEGVGDGAPHGAGEGAERPVEDVAQAAVPVDANASDGGVDGVGHGAPQRARDGALDGVGHPVEHGVPHGAGDGVSHGVEDGAGHRVRDGVPHSIFHLPTSNIQLPDSQSRRACSDARARDGDAAELRDVLLTKASAVVGRQLEVDEIELLDGWLAEGIPGSLIDSALADGLRTKVYRLKWVDHRLRELERGHLHQHPELLHDDLDLERSVAVSSLSNDAVAGHLSKTKRKRAKSAIRRASTAEQVRSIIDTTLAA